MTEAERHHFDLLKQRIAEVRGRGRTLKPVEEWSGREIREFQDELQEEVQGSVSEKWFYTHFKGEGHDKLPRIDTLDLLSRYVGYENWEAFKADHPYEGEAEKEQGKSSRLKLLVQAGGLLLLLSIIGSIPLFRPDQGGYRLCFVDADTGERIRSEKLELRILEEGESPLVKAADTNGCIQLDAGLEKLRFVVEAPYYKRDTILRTADRPKKKERIPLEKDDYAIMIGTYSEQDPEDREKRRQRLEGMIAEDARIFQVQGEEQMGVEMYNKAEFIDKLTLPLQSLRRIEILETRYDAEGRIRSIRFRQKEDEKE